MELFNLKFSENIRFHVLVHEDYHIKGSFDPNAASDIEFYGCRDTQFVVTGVDSYHFGSGEKAVWLPDDEETVKEFSKYFEDKITLIVQNAIDDKQENL